MNSFSKTALVIITAISLQTASCGQSNETVPTVELPTTEINGTVGGVVSDPQGIPLPMVTIRSLDSQHGSVTDNDGSFILSLPPGTHRLVYSARYFLSDTLLVKVVSDSMLVNNLVLESQF